MGITYSLNSDPILPSIVGHFDHTTLSLLQLTPSSSRVEATNMVFYFTSNVVSPAAYIYMGKDKVESKEHPSLQSSIIELTWLEMRT